MTIKELIEELKEYPEDLPVVLSSDGEGNHFHMASDMGKYKYQQSGRNSHVVADEDVGEYDDLIDVLVIWPSG